jgi:hypothetical protein
MLASSFIAIFLVPMLFYVVEKMTGGEGKHAKKAADAGAKPDATGGAVPPPSEHH